jgi:formylglycine-generating enzyme required for sulfatase activity
MHGNVLECVDDLWHNSYEGATVDGTAWLQGGNAIQRVVRGGSWYNIPQYLRAAIRDRNTTAYRDGLIGFRLARTLNP